MLFDRDGDVTGSFQISTTPQKILMDNTGRILLTDSVRIEQSEYEEFLHLLRKTIYQNSEEGRRAVNITHTKPAIVVAFYTSLFSLNFKSVGGDSAEPHTSELSPT